MIQINSKGEVRMVGTMIELMTDMTTLLHDYYKMTKDDVGEEAANRILALVGKVAVHEPWEIYSPASEECHEEMGIILDLIADHIEREVSE